MGCFNATKAACAGYQVTLYDLNEDALTRARTLCRGYMYHLAEIANYDTRNAVSILDRMAFTANFAGATAEADLVSESVFEQLALKREVHRSLDDLCPAHTILTTNSSFLLGSQIEGAVGRGDRFAAMHSYMASPLIDIVASGRTSPKTLQTLEAYARSLHATPLMLKKEHPGYVLNAMLGPLLSMALIMVAEGIASVEQVDKAWMTYRRAPIGPIGIMDIIGLGLIQSAWQNRPVDSVNVRHRAQVLAILDPMVAANQLGASTGQGFYSYPEPSFAQSEFLAHGQVNEALYNPLMAVWIANAIKISAAGVADPKEIDRAWMVGTSLDQGPFATLNVFGREPFLALLDGLVIAGRFDRNDMSRISEYLRCIA